MNATFVKIYYNNNIIISKKKGKGRHLIYNNKVVTNTKFQIKHHIKAS